MLYQKIGDKLDLVNFYHYLLTNKIIYNQLSLKDRLKNYEFFIITHSLSKYINIIKYIINNTNNIYLELNHELIYLYDNHEINIKILNKNFEFYYLKQITKLSLNISKLKILEKYINNYDVLYIYKPMDHQRICLCVRNIFGKNKYINISI